MREEVGWKTSAQGGPSYERVDAIYHLLDRGRGCGLALLARLTVRRIEKRDLLSGDLSA